MHIKWIEDFIALADTLSFSRASEIRNITQPALSRRIQALEEWLDAALVDRSTHPFTLTRAGQLFYEKAPDILQSLAQLKHMLHEDNPGTERFLKITSSHSLASSFLPMWLHTMHQKIGSFNSRVGSTDVREAIASLAAHDTDLVLCYYHPQAPVMLDALQYDFLTLGRETMLPVCAPADSGKPLYALPGRPAHPVRFLSYSDETFMHRVVNIILARNQEPCFLAASYETAVSLLLRKMAQLGHGMAWLPESLVREDLVSKRLVLAGDERWMTEIEIRAYRARANNNPLLQQLWTILTHEK
jgi:LysR family transcriptional regulator, hypochlorite-specific transcription factor HypT